MEGGDVEEGGVVSCFSRSWEKVRWFPTFWESTSIIFFVFLMSIFKNHLSIVGNCVKMYM